MEIKPLGSRVLIEEITVEEVTKSGIVLAPSARKKTQTAYVKAVGNGTEKSPITVSVGDKVIYALYSGTELEIEGKKLRLVEMDDILAQVKE